MGGGVGSIPEVGPLFFVQIAGRRWRHPRGIADRETEPGSEAGGFLGTPGFLPDSRSVGPGQMVRCVVGGLEGHVQLGLAPQSTPRMGCRSVWSIGSISDMAAMSKVAKGIIYQGQIGAISGLNPLLGRCNGRIPTPPPQNRRCNFRWVQSASMDTSDRPLSS